MKLNILFLDVDGVLNRCGVSGQGLETALVAHLRRIIEESDPIIVVSSTWRNTPHQLDRLRLLFHSLGARYGGCTPHLVEELPSGIVAAKQRCEEILAWLDEAGHPPHFVILDDDDREMGALIPYLIKTESHVGLTDEIADKVIASLKTE